MARTDNDGTAAADQSGSNHSGQLSRLKSASARTLFSVTARPRIGITGHLTISFVAVAALAGALNLLVQQGVSIVEITRIETRTPPPQAAPPSTVTPQAEHDSTEAVPNAELRLAVEEFARATIQRARFSGAENDGHVVAARLNVEAELRKIGRVTERRAIRAAERALQAYFNGGAEVIVLGDQRRAIAKAYSDEIVLIDQQLDASFDRGWRILGRVLARETLVQLRDDFEEILRSSAALSDAAAPDTTAVDALIANEAAFRRTFEENARSFRRAESAQWVESVNTAFDRLVLLREAVLESWIRLATSEGEFGRAREQVRIGIEALVVVPAPVASPTPSVRVFVGPPILRETAFVGPPLLDASDLVEEERISRRETETFEGKFVAALTAGGLLLVLLVSITTVQSIVVPIRRLLKATTLLASGQHEPVPGGGIKELDNLAQAFNQMAAELIAARRSSERQQSELEARVAERTRQLQELAEGDPVTGLPNRRHLIRLLNRELERSRRSGQIVGVFFLDLDNFKNVNDSMGHAFGDEVLQAVAARLRDTVERVGFAARLGGDEFTVVVTDAGSVDAVRAAGLALITAFQSPLTIGNRALIVSVSAGASMFPLHEQDAEGLLKAADAALFRAKALGRNQLSIFTPELLSEAAARFSTEQGLRRAIERQEFELVFQPEIHADAPHDAIVEALVRWRLPDGRLAAPREFLAVAEDSGLIAEISDWIMHSAIETAAAWHHGEWPDARVAINVSARQLLDPHFITKIERLLQHFQLPARCIEIELTETVLQTGAATVNALQALANSGFAIALDDFGSGYSSLASLEKLPFTRVKLDRSLVDGIAKSVRSASIARAIIWLCQSLKLEVTAEGVETLDQLEMLCRFRPLYLQGYLLCQPVAASEVVATIKRLAPHVSQLLEAATSLNRDASSEHRLRAVPSIEHRTGTGDRRDWAKGSR